MIRIRVRPAGQRMWTTIIPGHSSTLCTAGSLSHTKGARTWARTTALWVRGAASTVFKMSRAGKRNDAQSLTFNCGVDSFGILSICLSVLAGPEAVIDVSDLADAVAQITSTGTRTTSTISRAKSSASPSALDAAKSTRCLLVRNSVTLALAMLITTLAESMC
jgi:hypothetical protein